VLTGMGDTVLPPGVTRWAVPMALAAEGYRMTGQIVEGLRT
jgi:hypothetical protein